MLEFLDLLLHTSNPLTRAEYFGVIFDKVPTYQEIKDGNTKCQPYTRHTSDISAGILAK